MGLLYGSPLELNQSKRSSKFAQNLPRWVVVVKEIPPTEAIQLVKVSQLLESPYSLKERVPSVYILGKPEECRTIRTRVDPCAFLQIP